MGLGEFPTSALSIAAVCLMGSPACGVGDQFGSCFHIKFLFDIRPVRIDSLRAHAKPPDFRNAVIKRCE
jgi:hypothetical protein